MTTLTSDNTLLHVARAPRDRGLDLLRALALGRVVLWHATGYAALTWVGALPTMVLLSALLIGESTRRRGLASVLRDRVRRLLVPLWAYALVMWSVMIGVEWHAGRSVPWRRIAFWIVPVGDPQGTDWSAGWLSQPLWYVRLLLWLYACTPLLLFAARRAPRSAMVVLGIATVLAERQWGSHWWAVQDLLMFSVFFVGGLAVANGRLRPFGFAWRVTVPIGLAVALLQLWTHGIGRGVVNDSHTLHLGVGLITVGLAGCCMGSLRRVAAAWSHAVDVVARRSLTVYLWHPAAIAVIMWETRSWRDWSGDGALTRLCVVVLALTLTAAMVWIVGPLEDRAARRKVRPRSVPAGFGVLAVVAVLCAGLWLPRAGEAAFALPVPSQAPRLGDYSGAVPLAAAASNVQRRAAADGVLTPVAQLDRLAPLVGVGTDAALSTLLDDFSARHAPTGAGAVVLRPGVARWAGTAGTVAVSHDEPVDLMSITKTFTAALVLRAVDQGLIGLDDEVGVLDVAPWFTLARHVTFRQLLAHTSGLPHYFDSPLWKQDPRLVDGWQVVLRQVQAMGLSWAPGTHAGYSSTNYVVAALALAQREHEPIETLIRRELLAPLHLDGISVNLPKPGVPATGASGMVASMDDLARWADALWSDAQLLAPATQQIHVAVDPSSMMGPGTFGYCPCGTDARGVRHQAAIGYTGGRVTVRYYPAFDAVVVVASRTSLWSPGVPEAVDALAAALAAGSG